ncbi:hypothetical protein Vafri_1092 [Volvox africanus]|nr:hypothetical protein Vafri_1092 [Volvox africanus]
MELLAQLLTRAPVLLELALLRVTVFPDEEDGKGHGEGKSEEEGEREEEEEEEEEEDNHKQQLAAEEISAEAATSTSNDWRTRHQLSPPLASAQLQGGIVSGPGGNRCGAGVGWCSVLCFLKLKAKGELSGQEVGNRNHWPPAYVNTWGTSYSFRIPGAASAKVASKT